MLQLALLKMGFDPATIAAMPEGEAKAYLEAHREATNPPRKKQYKVVRKKTNG